jgi:hypothetical protein
MNKMFREQANDFKKRIDSMLELNEGWIKKMHEYEGKLAKYNTESQLKIVSYRERLE